MARRTKERKEVQKFWFQGLTEAMDQATDPVLTKGTELMKNATLDRPGFYASRKGSDLLQSKIGTNPGYGLWTYNSTDGSTRKMMAVTDRDLYVLNEATGWGSAVDTDEWTDAKDVDATDFLNRSYIGCADGTTALAYGTGSTITDITPTIGGNILAVNKNILAVGGNNLKPDIIFYSDAYTDTFHSATGTCAANADVGGANTVTTTTEIFETDMIGAVLYNTTDGEMNIITDWTDGDTVTTSAATSGWDNDTIYVMQNAFKITGKCTGTVSYRDNFISFDVDNMYIWDPTVPPHGFMRKIPGFGCTSLRTVKVVSGYLIWVNRDGIWLWNGEGLPQDITGKIRDKIDGFGLFDLISDSNWASLAAWAVEPEGKYILSVGTLSTVSGAPASATTSAMFEFNTRTGNWTLNGYQDRFRGFTTFINTNGAKDVYGIGDTDAAVWKLYTGTTDDNSAAAAQNISVDIRVPWYQFFDDPTVASKVNDYFVKYTSSGNVSVYDGVDGSYSSTVIGTLTTNATPKTVSLGPLPNREGFAHSLKFVSTSKFRIEGYGFLATKGTTPKSVRL